MKKLRIFLLALCMILANVTMTTNIMDIKAETTQTTYSGTNVGHNNYNDKNAPSNSFLSFENDKIVRVQNLSDNSLLIENYDLSYNFIDSKTIGAEAEKFGGVYFASDANYLVWGNDNSDQDDTKEVFRISKYDKNWNYLSSCGLNGANTTVAFRAGYCDMVMSGTSLIVRTSHQMYTSDDGNRHQANVTIVVNTETMQIANSVTGVVYYDKGYGSHSFDQKIEMDGSDVIMVDHIDAYPTRAFEIYKLANFDGTTIKNATYTSLYNFQGNTGDNYTGASLGGLAISPSKYLVAGNSVVQDENYTTYETRNIFVVASDKELSSTSINWLTNYSEGEETCNTPFIEKIDDNKFIVLWGRSDGVYYTFVDGNGQTISETIFMKDASLSDCEPKLNGNKLVWYTWKDEEIKFYEINMDDVVHPGVITLNNGVRDERQYCTDGVHAQIIDCEQIEPTCTKKGLKPRRQCSRCKEYLKPGSDSEVIDVATIEIPALGHDYSNYELNGDGTFTSHCSRCDSIMSGTVPTSLTMYFKTGSLSGSFSSGCSNIQNVGTALNMFPSNINPSDADSSLLFEISDPEIASVKQQGRYYIFTFKKPGKVKIIITAKFNSEITRTLDLTIQCADGTHQPKYVDQVNATCSNAGYQAHWECEACGAWLNNETEQQIVYSWSYQIPALGHDYSREEIHDDGTYTTYCSRCDSTITGKCPTSMRFYFNNSLNGAGSYSTSVNSKQKIGMPLNVWVTDVSPSGANKEVLFEISDPEIASAELDSTGATITFHKVGAVNIKISAKYNPSIYRNLSLTVECADDGHEVQFVDRVEPTCSENGAEAHYECSICHKRLLEDGSIDANPSDITINKLGHDYSIHHQKVDATCTQTGLLEHDECSRCHELILIDGSVVESADLVIEALGHDWTNHEAVAATCEENGKLAYKECSRCHELRLMDDSVVEDEASLIVNKLGHDYSIHYDQVNSTCTNAGKKAYQECSRCHNKTLMDGTLVSDDDLVIEALGHNWIIHPQVNATCNSDGIRAYNECLRCNELQLSDGSIVANRNELVIPKHGHNYSIHFNRVNPTCTDMGTKEYQECSRCHNKTLMDGTAVTDGDLMIIALGHDWINHEKVEATCQHSGVDAYKECNRCNELQLMDETIVANRNELIIPQLKHNWTSHDEVAATCTNAGKQAYKKCNACHEMRLMNETVIENEADLVIEALGHDWNNHERVEATCEENGKVAYKQCNTCHEIRLMDETVIEDESLLIVNKLGHDYSIHYDQVEATCTNEGMIEYQECSRCHNKTLMDGTLVSDDELVIQALGHNWINHLQVDATCEHAGVKAYKECNACHEMRLMNETVIENEADLIIEALGHDWNNHERVEATCEENGKVAYKQCNTCHEIRLMDETVIEDENLLIVNKLGHDYIHHEKIEATCSNEGRVEYQECSRCHNKTLMDGTSISDSELVIAKIAHNWTNHDEVVATCANPGKQAYKECKACHEMRLMNETVIENEADLIIEALEHDWINHERVEATCEENGKVAYKQCNTCHEIRLMDETVIEDENLLIVNKLEHDYIHHEKVEATCSNEGTIEYQECSRCHNKTLMDGTSISDSELVIAKIAHNWTNHDEVVATCANPGKQAYKECKACHEIRLMNETVVENEADLIIEALDHEWNNYDAINATCDTDGKVAYKECNACHEIRLMNDSVVEDETSLIVNKLGHDYIHHEKVEATCSNEGTIEYQECSRCHNKTLMDGTSVSDSELVIEKIDHEWISHDEVAPTCKDNGKQAYKECNVCHEIRLMNETVIENETDLVIEALDHEWINHEKVEATCNQNGKVAYKECSRCHELQLMNGSVVADEKQLIIAKLAHEYKFSRYSNGKYYQKCINCHEEVECEAIFKDVNPKAWYVQSVYDAYAKGLMVGIDKANTLFAPDNNISRGMVATVLYRMAGTPKVTFTNKFPDVKANIWYSNAIIWANQVGIVKGYNTGKFGPDDNITRQDLAIMLRNYAVNVGKLKANEKADLSNFKDVKSISPYAIPSLQWAVANKLISGKENGTKVAPIDNATRAECAKMFNILSDICSKKAN